MLIGFQKSKWILFFVLLFFAPITFSGSTHPLHKSDAPEASRPLDIKHPQRPENALLIASQTEDPKQNMLPVLKDIVPRKNGAFPFDSTRTLPHIGQMPEELQDLPQDKPPLSIGQITETFIHDLMEEDPHILQDIPKELTESPPERPLLSIGDMEQLKDTTPGITPPSFSKNRNALDLLIANEKQNKEIQTATQQLFQAIESGNGDHYRILIKYILMSYSPAQVLSILHAVQERSENTPLHFLAKTSSREWIHELRTLTEAFLPFDIIQRPLSDTRALAIPEEFRRTASIETTRSSLWKLKTPIDLDRTNLAKAIQERDLAAYRKIRNHELLKPGITKVFLAAIYGNTLTGKSLYDLMEEAQRDEPEFAGEIEILAKWFTLPLYKRNRKGLTPLLIAQDVFKKRGFSEPFVILSTVEMGLGMDTEKTQKPKQNGLRSFALSVIGIGCLFSFQNIE